MRVWQTLPAIGNAICTGETPWTYSHTSPSDRSVRSGACSPLHPQIALHWAAPECTNHTSLQRTVSEVSREIPCPASEHCHALISLRAHRTTHRKSAHLSTHTITKHTLYHLFSCFVQAAHGEEAYPGTMNAVCQYLRYGKCMVLYPVREGYQERVPGTHAA